MTVSRPERARLRRLGPLAATCASAVVVATACGVQGLSFVQDRRVTIVAPGDRDEVSLPVTLEWEVDDFTVTGPTDVVTSGAGYFAIFVDRTPQPPGKPLSWLARNDDGCVASRGCPDADWFAQRNVFTTTGTSFTIESVSADDDDRREFHEVTIVLLDGAGNRIGEGAFTRKFQIERDG